MTYNIQTGGQDDFDFSRLALARQVMAAEHPDILVLQELVFADVRGNRVLHQIENDLGMRSFVGEAATGSHVAVLVRRHARVTKSAVDSSHFHHATVEVGVETSRGPLTVIGTHLCPYGGMNRLGEAQRLANHARPDRMVLLMGDLNSLDPWHDHTDQVAGLPPHYRSRHLLPGDATAVDTRTIATLTNAGFADPFRQCGTGSRDYTAPTRHGGGGEFNRMRIDYILGSPPLARLAAGCYVSERPECETASDHYPLIAELDLDLAT